MTAKEMDKKILELLEYEKNENGGTLEGEIAYNLIEGIKDQKCNSLTFLQERYGDKGLKYGVDPVPYLEYYLHIESLIGEYIFSAKEHINLSTYLGNGIWFAEQIFIQKLLTRIGVLNKEDVLYKK